MSKFAMSGVSCRTEPHPLYLDGRSPCYWVCAYANNQWNLGEEISDELQNTSFFRAMRLAKGTVSVIDELGISWGRIWCVFELWQSLSHAEGRTYDMYTALSAPMMCKCLDLDTMDDEEKEIHAVGITDGLIAAEPLPEYKSKREKVFPMELLDIGIGFSCLDGKASVPDDERRIKDEIGTESTNLDNLVHGVVATSGLQQALKRGLRIDHYLEALRRGRVRTLKLDLTKNSEIDTEAMCKTVVSVLESGIVTSFVFCSQALQALPESLGGCTSLAMLELNGCSELRALPESLGGCTSLATLDLSDCKELRALPESLGGCTSLATLDLSDCLGLRALPGLGDGVSVRGLSDLDQSLREGWAEGGRKAFSLDWSQQSKACKLKAIVAVLGVNSLLDVEGAKSLLSQISDVPVERIPDRHPELQLLIGISVDMVIERLTLLVDIAVVDRCVDQWALQV